MSGKKTPITGTIELYFGIGVPRWAWYIVSHKGEYMVEAADHRDYGSRAAALQVARRAAKLLGIKIESVEGDGSDENETI